MMNRLVRNFVSTAFTILLLTGFSASLQAQPTDTPQQLLKLKIYHLDTAEQEQRLHNYLENAYLPALHRMDAGPVGVFHPVGQDTVSDRRVYVLTEHTSLEAMEQLEERLASDQTYRSAGASFIEAAHDNPVFSEIETVLMRAFSYAPTLMKSGLDTPKSERVYELRSYESATEAQNINKVEMFNEGGEVELFDELDFNAIFYGNTVAGSDMPNLVYMISFADMEARDEHWEAFINSPTWERISSMDKYQNNVSHIDNYFLRATEYSDL